MPFFVKYHGAGNDFVLIDCTEQLIPDDLPALARHVCERRYGVGADGLLLIYPSQVADYRMRIFNADGSEPAMCGNGIRCVADYIFHYKTSKSALFIETMRKILACRNEENGIVVDLGPPVVMHGNEPYVVDTGVPHAVLFVPDVDTVVFPSEAQKIRFDPRFAPHGVNVNFASLRDDMLYVRTYERGVEGETLACGTGAAAAAFIAQQHYGKNGPIAIATRTSLNPLEQSYRCNLHVDFLGKEKSVVVRGFVKEVFKGELSELFN